MKCSLYFKVPTYRWVGGKGGVHDGIFNSKTGHDAFERDWF